MKPIIAMHYNTDDMEFGQLRQKLIVKNTKFLYLFTGTIMQQRKLYFESNAILYLTTLYLTSIQTSTKICTCPTQIEGMKNFYNLHRQ